MAEPTFSPVDHDPFATVSQDSGSGPLVVTVAPNRQPKFTPVDGDPFAEKPSMAMSAARGAMQGLTFGLADESYGLMRGIGSVLSGGGFREGYNQGVDEYRARDRAARDANPVSSIVGEIGGGMGTGLGLARSGVTLMRAGMSLPQAIGAGAAEGAAYGAAYGAGNAEGGPAERLQGALDGGKTGLAVGGAVPVAARAIGAATRAITPFAVAPERQAAINVLEREGVPLSAGQKSGSKALQYAESFFGDAPLAGGKASAAMGNQADAFTDATMRRVGSSGRATPENMGSAYDRIGQQFNELSANNAIKPDQKLVGDIVSTVNEYSKVLPSEQKKIVGNLVADIITTIDQHGGVIPGNIYQAARSRMSRMASGTTDPEYANALRGLRDTLDSAMSRSLSPEDAAAWATARRQYGNWKDLSKAVGGAGENAANGLVSPQSLRTAIASGKNRAAYVRGEGDFADLARAGNSLMTPLPNSGTAQRNLMSGMVGGGGASLATGNPLIAAITALGPGAFGRSLWSGPVQKYLSNQAISPTAMAAIENRVRAALQGGAQSQSPRLPSPSR